MLLAPKTKFLFFNSAMVLVGGVSGAEHGLRLWQHFTRVEVLTTPGLVFEAAFAGLMVGVIVICAARLVKFWQARGEGK